MLEFFSLIKTRLQYIHSKHLECNRLENQIVFEFIDILIHIHTFKRNRQFF